MPDYQATDEQKEKSRAECDELRTRFETLRFGDSKGIRTPVIGVRGQRTNHYTIEPYFFVVISGVFQTLIL